MKLLTYNLGLPEFKWGLFCYLMKVFSVGIFTTSIVNSIWYFPIWFGCLKILPRQEFFLSRKVKFYMVNLETHSYQTKKPQGDSTNRKKDIMILLPLSFIYADCTYCTSARITQEPHSWLWCLFSPAEEQDSEVLNDPDSTTSMLVFRDLFGSSCTVGVLSK
jgi:hypothetical protein